MLSAKRGGDISNGRERPLRQHLIGARAKIVAQLGKKYSPAYAGGAAGPPDFRDQIAKLQSELRDMDDLLGTSEDDDA